MRLKGKGEWNLCKLFIIICAVCVYNNNISRTFLKCFHLFIICLHFYANAADFAAGGDVVDSCWLSIKHKYIHTLLELSEKELKNESVKKNSSTSFTSPKKKFYE